MSSCDFHPLVVSKYSKELTGSKKIIKRKENKRSEKERERNTLLLLSCLGPV
jgi:hypothetical protein